MDLFAETPEDEDEPVWFDGKNIDEVAFCEAHLARHPMKCIHGKLYDLNGTVDTEKLENELYAFQLSPGISGTYGGVMTNVNSEVIDNSDAVVPGLYAAGEAAFCGLIGENGYPMCGYAVGTACFFGRAAGTNAAAYAGK